MTDEKVDSETEDSTPNSGPKILPEDQLAEGDCLFYVSLLPEVESVWATQTTFQQLAEAHQWNLEKTAKIPDYLQEFEDVFSKESFNALPEQKVWDHAIELEPGSSPAFFHTHFLPSEPKQLILVSSDFHLTRQPSSSPQKSSAGAL